MRRLLTGITLLLLSWLDSFGQGPMPEEAAAFMYAQLAIEEMP